MGRGVTGLYVPVLPPGATPETAAHLYADAGLHVLPVRPGSKHAGELLGKGWQHQTTTGHAAIEKWFRTAYPGAAVAHHPGASGAVALDVDTPENIPVTLRAAIEQCNPP